ncbi:MAG: glutamine synthetase adenylyltransferase [Planctomycetaceae bacterium]|nr:glutamine synthetase adenylyltransferase [Planctomycetaceae bacterium]
MHKDVEKHLSSTGHPGSDSAQWLAELGFSDAPAAAKRLQILSQESEGRDALIACLPSLMTAISDSASPDVALLNFERFAQSVEDRGGFYEFLRKHPRAVEILVTLFVCSQFLTEILLKNPTVLPRLTLRDQLANFKPREEFIEEFTEAAASVETLPEKLDAVRAAQRWEFLRLGACDAFRLMDHKTITLQLALLADGVVQTCLSLLAEDMAIDASDFVVIAFGKLGGEELNYSSDIDLVFVAENGAERYWELGQRLIKVLMETTAQGFLYRVDMRLRPWGSAGPLVTNIDGFVDYLRSSGQLWEKQAVLKARCIAGNQLVGSQLLQRLSPIVFDVSPDDVRANVREMKQRIETQLTKTGREWGDVKSGQGGIRDIEFITQSLQLIHGRVHPGIRSISTLDALVRLANYGVIQADEYRRLSTAYMFLRTIEHALQLMHNKQTHSLPQDRKELGYLARRLDFPGPDEFQAHYEQHCREVRTIFDSYLNEHSDTQPEIDVNSHLDIRDHLGNAVATYEEQFTADQIALHLKLLSQLDDETIVRVHSLQVDESRWELTVVGYDQLGDLSIIAGLLFVFGYDIESGHVFTGSYVDGETHGNTTKEPIRKRKFVNVFLVRPPLDVVPPAVWQRYESDLRELLDLLRRGKADEAHGRLAKRVAGALRITPASQGPLLPVEIDVQNTADPDSTVLQIQGEDTPGFLYELSNAASLSGTSIVRMQIITSGRRVLDTLHVTDRHGRKIESSGRLREMRAAIVLIKHFTHLLPSSPNPEAALLHFRELLSGLFERRNWIAQLADLQQPEVLRALAAVLGGSDFLWEDFLRLQHANLFPVVTDIEGLQHPKSRKQLSIELADELYSATNLRRQQEVLNEFKDREMLRIDLRHILNLQDKFGMFSHELTDLAEVIVDAAHRFCFEHCQAIYGAPQSHDGTPAPFAVCALGKCGGRELGFASDIELMFIYDEDGQTTGTTPISTREFFQHLVECFVQSIRAKRQGVFEIDLRLRPYGQAGSLAISLQAFEQYFTPTGPAWPYERQALVKLRPIAGDTRLGRRIVEMRDRLIYTGQPFDVTAMRAMREKQVQQLVKAGTFNAKLSPGGLADCEYLVQGLQITHGHIDPSLRSPNTRDALKALQVNGVISSEDRLRLRDAYRFLRRLIDALRMVRGDARDLTVPPADSEEFEFLARRLRYQDDIRNCESDIEKHTSNVISLTRLLDSPSS